MRELMNFVDQMARWIKEMKLTSHMWPIKRMNSISFQDPRSKVTITIAKYGSMIANINGHSLKLNHHHQTLHTRGPINFIPRLKVKVNWQM